MKNLDFTPKYGVQPLMSESPAPIPQTAESEWWIDCSYWPGPAFRKGTFLDVQGMLKPPEFYAVPGDSIILVYMFPGVNTKHHSGAALYNLDDEPVGFIESFHYLASQNVYTLNVRTYSGT